MWIDGNGNFKRFEEANLEDFVSIIFNKDNKISNKGLDAIKCLELIRKYPYKIRINGRIYNDNEYLIDEIMVLNYIPNDADIIAAINDKVGIPYSDGNIRKGSAGLYLYYKPGATTRKINSYIL